jgi:hypothetical protein
VERTPRAIIQDLHDLIDAIDRRLPQVQRAGEAAVANAAMRLRIEARARIAELERQDVIKPADLPRG